MPTYHRKATRSQTLDTAMRQLATNQIWGHPIHLVGEWPAVKAYLGALGATEDGIQFDTDVVPDAHGPNSTVRWPKMTHGNAEPVPGSNDACFIQVRVTVIRYRLAGNLARGVEWIK